MEPEVNNRTATESSYGEESVSFPRITDVATGWIVDFMFVSLCRHFREGHLDEFNETLSSFKEISQSPSLKGTAHEEKILIMAFLARVMHGKELDVEFEEDKLVMPLMSAANIWSDLEDTVKNESLFKEIKILLFVQAVAVCLEKGETSSASSALKWFDNNHLCPKNLRVKLSTVVNQRETYHSFLMTFSFERLLETVQSFLDAYLESNPSDFLLKAATKMVLSSQSNKSLDDGTIQDSLLDVNGKSTTEDKREMTNTSCLRIKRKLMSTKITDVWKPDTCKKPVVTLRRFPIQELSWTLADKAVDSSPVRKQRKPPEKWTPQLDKCLRAGILEHGPGKWSQILMDYDFKGRTGTMLKDRWRVLHRADMI